MRRRTQRREEDSVSDTAGVPVVFVHGLWLHASSWDSWVGLFNDNGYHAVAPGWPGDSATAGETRGNTGALANRGIAEVTNHYSKIIADLPVPPIVMTTASALRALPSTLPRPRAFTPCRCRRSSRRSPCSRTRPTATAPSAS